METIELLLLVIAYTLLILTLFLQFVCYKRNLEKLESIAFTLSLLFLIVSMSISPLLQREEMDNTTNVFTLLSMIVVGVTTPLSIMSERHHKIPDYWKTVLFICATVLFLLTGIKHFTGSLIFLEYVITAFLGISVVLSMVLLRRTKPKQFIAHRDKIERFFAIAFLVIVPLSLLTNYVLVEGEYELRIGFTLPLVFILLSGSKLFDDLQRLSLLKPKLEHKEQHFKNYSLSNREQEIAILLTQGRTYKEIAEALYISIPTVKTHASNLYKKCGVKNRSELTALLIS